MRTTRRILCLGICLIVAGAELLPRVAHAAKPSNRQHKVDTLLRKLEKQITEVRGLKFKSPVVAMVIPRSRDSAGGIQGYYSIKDKKIFLYDDIAGAYERGVLIHEMVHALQDQNFGLAKLHQKSFASDAELALAALIEGDATFTMIEVLKKDQPRVAAMLDAPLEKARNLQNAFLYAQGARYVKALKERGGWQAVNSIYRFTPGSTAAVLHPKGVLTIDLGPGKTRGEFGIIQMLAENPATAPLAVRTANGWMGDVANEKGQTKSWVVVFAKKENALRFQKALAKVRGVQNPRFQSVRAETGFNLWHGPKGEVLAVLARGDRILALEAPDQMAYKGLLDRLEGPPALRIYSRKDKRFITFGELIDRLLEADLVCIGETHDSEPDHRVQLQIIKSLFARDERLGVGMEMFQRPYQKVIDRYFQTEFPEEDFLKQTEYRKRWGFPWMLYRPIVEFCRKNGIALAALNVPAELKGRLSKAGYAKLSADEKKQLGPIDYQNPEHRAYWYERLAKMHGKNKVPPEQKERSYQVMTAWDEYMGASAAAFQKARALRRMVILAGSGHIDRGFGIPARAAKRTGGKVATIHIEAGGDPKKMVAEPVADYMVQVE
jgi:uncharacterized iron-regulated protein